MDTPAGPKRKTFVCLDTNILIRIATQGKPDCEMEHWEKLKKLASDGQLTLLVPIVIRLEFRKHLRNFVDDFGERMAKFNAALKDLIANENGYWNESSALIANFASQWDRSKEEHISACKSRFAEIDNWLRYDPPKGVEHLEFNEKIMVAVKLRMIGGGHPGMGSRRLESDLAIIETLIARFRNRDENAELLLCTENVKDFAVTPDDPTVIHHHFRLDLPTTEIFTNLASLITFVEKGLPIQKPTEIEIKDAEAKAAAAQKVAAEMTWMPTTVATVPGDERRHYVFNAGPGYFRIAGNESSYQIERKVAVGIYVIVASVLVEKGKIRFDRSNTFRDSRSGVRTHGTAARFRSPVRRIL